MGDEELKISMVGDWKIQGGKGKGEWVKGKRKGGRYWKGKGGKGKGYMIYRIVKIFFIIVLVMIFDIIFYAI
jgi:hypothetical protein